jgi:hypothetical protein
MPFDLKIGFEKFVVRRLVYLRDWIDLLLCCFRHLKLGDCSVRRSFSIGQPPQLDRLVKRGKAKCHTGRLARPLHPAATAGQTAARTRHSDRTAGTRIAAFITGSPSLRQ